MTDLVLDAVVVIKWFARQDEPGAMAAQALRESYRKGEVRVTVASLLFLEIINVAGRRWRWGTPPSSRSLPP